VSVLCACEAAAPRFQVGEAVWCSMAGRQKRHVVALQWQAVVWQVVPPADIRVHEIAKAHGGAGVGTVNRYSAEAGVHGR